MQDSETCRPKRRLRRILLSVAAVFAVYLSAEAFLPPACQPSARVLVGAIHLYQATLSPLMGKVVTCKFRPTCSHYGATALEKYGTLGGTLKTVGRIWRCSPWGPPPGEDLP